MIYRELVEALFLWLFRNPACADLTVSERIKTGLKNTGFVYLLHLFGGKVEKQWCDLVCVKRL